MKSFLRTMLAGAVMGAVGLSMIQRRLRGPERFVARMAWRAGRDLAPRAARLTRAGGRRLMRFARKIG
jgi:hypothetical protein